MPVIPQYNAGQPAAPVQPALERERRPRVAAGAQIGALGNLSNKLMQGTEPLPNLNPELGQASARGMGVIDAGVERLGEVMFDLRVREAEARNLSDIHDSQLEMERVAGKYEVWQTNNPDPRGWEKGWQNHSEAFQSSYFEGKELSNEARDAISKGIEGFDVEQSVKVGVAAARKTFDNGRKAGLAMWTRQVDEKDPGHRDTAQYLYDEDYIGEDEMVRMQIRGDDDIQTSTIKAGTDLAETHILNGDPEAAKDVYRGLPMEPEEIGLQVTRVDKVHAVNIKIKEIDDQIYEEGGAWEVVRRLTAVGPGNELANDKEVRGQAREDLKKKAYAIHHEDREEVLKSVLSEIDGGEVTTREELQISLAGMNATEEEVDALEVRMAGEVLGTARDRQTLHSKASGYNPADDIYGVKESALRVEILMTLPNTNARQDILDELSARAGGKKLSMSDHEKEVAKKKHFDAMELQGDWLIEADKPRKVTLPDGREEWFIDAPDTQPDDPNYFVEEPGFLKGIFMPKRVGRIVRFSKQDLIKLGKDGDERKGLLVEDTLMMDTRYEEANSMFATLDDAQRNGELKSTEEWEAKRVQLSAGDKDANGRRWSELEGDGGQGSTMPRSSKGQQPENGLFQVDPISQLQSIENATGN